MLRDAIPFCHVESKHPILDYVKVGNGTSKLHIMIYFEIMFIIFLLNIDLSLPPFYDVKN